jgi:photosystem II stability/assembly factor-like uncharacterized protein
VTADGGYIWTSYPFNPRHQDYSAIACPTSNQCWAGSQDGDGGLLRTVDAGHSWQQWETPAGWYLWYITGLTCVTSTRCLAVGDSTASDSTPLVPTLYTTRDAGKSWQMRTSTAFRDSSGIPADLSSIACPKPNSCLIVGSYGSIFESATAY